ncbi:MAG: DNA-3-methyladenine glycosylase [bacterium]|nr:DNA-3-methyladenine glycosylase [bacterium]
MKKILKSEFFNRKAHVVARGLLGKFLVQKIGKNEIACVVTETEAYDGPHDRASHASKGRTARTEIMFGSAGYFYVYLCYGMHFMLNVVTGPKEYPAAVLIRGVEGHTGPGKLTKYLKIDKNLNAQRASVKSGLWFEDRGVRIKKSQIKKTPRIGVSYAGQYWSRRKLRFMLCR